MLGLCSILMGPTPTHYLPWVPYAFFYLTFLLTHFSDYTPKYIGFCLLRHKHPILTCSCLLWTACTPLPTAVWPWYLYCAFPPIGYKPAYLPLPTQQDANDSLVATYMPALHPD